MNFLFHRVSNPAIVILVLLSSAVGFVGGRLAPFQAKVVAVDLHDEGPANSDEMRVARPHRIDSESGITQVASNLAVSTNFIDAQIAAVIERQRKGEYVLNCDDPRYREAFAQLRKSAASSITPSEADGFRSFLSAAGVSLTLIEGLLNHKSQIRDASAQVSESLHQLADAQGAYDKRIRSILNDEQYRAYRDNEEMRHVDLEWMPMLAFAASMNRPIREQFEEVIRALIMQEQAYSNQYFGGPYDPPPSVVAGRENVIAALQANIDNVTERSAALTSKARELGLPNEVTDVVSAYYESIIKSKKVTMELVRVHQPVHSPPP